MGDCNTKRKIPLAIVGMACRLPGAENLDEYWQLLVEGRCAVGDLPADRLDQELYYDPRKGVRGKSYSRRGGIVDWRFDADRCPIPPDLVRQADPTHLMICQVAADALRHAGMDPLNVPLRNTGVYVGHTMGSPLNGDQAYTTGIEEAAQCLRDVELFRELPQHQQEQFIDAFVRNVRDQFPVDAANDRDLAANMAAGLISKTFALDGPFMAVNSACASSLQSLLLAARSLQRGAIDMAIVGGASVCSPDWLVIFSAAQAVSATQSRPFDHRADGVIISEGYAAVVVKTLARALADGDPIQAIIRGIGISSDGKGRSLWAPQSEGQTEAIRRAHEAGLDIADLQYVEAHSTATQLGDATEIAALSDALKGAFPATKKIPITSVKANIGHTLEAAGLAGIVKTVLCLQHRLIPAAANIEKLNPSIDWNGAPVYVPRQNSAWPTTPPGKPRRAGVNAFGIGGLNAHVVLDAYDGTTDMALPIVSGTRSRDEEAVAVIGCGCVYPGADSLSAFWDLLQSGRDPKQPVPESHRRHDRRADHQPHGRNDDVSMLGGYVDGFQYDWRRHKIAPKQIEQADPLQFMVLDATDQALADAGYDRKPFDRARTGVFVGTCLTGDFWERLQVALRLPHACKTLRALLAAQNHASQRVVEIERAFTEAFHAKWPVLLDATGSFRAISLAARIVKTLNLRGGAAALDSGATSAMSALAAAGDLLVAGDCDMILCVAAQRNMNPRVYETLAAHGTLANDPTKTGPFDREGTGYVPGEGAAVFLLKRLSDTRHDGDPIHAIIRGVRAAHDHSSDALPLAIARVLTSADAQCGDLTHVMTDAAGIRGLDEQLVQSLCALQLDPNRMDPLLIGSVVGQIGHTGGASAGASLLAEILALEKQTAPGVFGLRRPTPGILRKSASIRCVVRPQRIRHATSDGRLLGAVVSQDKGLAYVALVERSVSPHQMDPQTIAHRAVLRLEESPASGDHTTAFTTTDSVLVLGESLAADAVRQRIASQGAYVLHLRPAQGVDLAISALRQLPAALLPRTIFLMTGMDPDATRIGDIESWQVRRRLGVELPYVLLQEWRKLLDQQGAREPCTLVAATLLGGDFGLAQPVIAQEGTTCGLSRFASDENGTVPLETQGFAQRVTAPEGGWIAGLLKSLRIEWTRRERPVRVKICDFAAVDSDEHIVTGLLRELGSDDPEMEVALGQGRRRVLRTVARPASPSPSINLPRGSTWIITGGARGITAEVAIALGQEYALDLHLVGRSEAPREDATWRNCSDDEIKQIKRSIVREAIGQGKSPEKQWERVKNDIEIYNNLRRMRQLGLRVTYHACDVSDTQTLSDTLARVRQTSGPILGIVHGAGYGRPGRFETRQYSELLAAIGAKLDGAVNLMNLTRDDPLRYFVGFGSISGRFGGNGLSDYAAANEMLAKLCAWYRTVRPECATTCIEWQSWDHVGMAMLPDSSVGIRDVLKMKFIPPAEGVEHLIQELRAGLPEGEVLIDDGEFERIFRLVDPSPDAVTNAEGRPVR